MSTQTMSDRDLLIRIANDSEHTKKSVDKLWKKSDELNTTMTAMRVTQDGTTKTLDTMSEAVFTGDNALSPRVRVLEERKRSSTGSSGFFSAVGSNRPPPRAPMPSVPDSPAPATGNATIKTLGGIVVALITVLGTILASR